MRIPIHIHLESVASAVMFESNAEHLARPGGEVCNQTTFHTQSESMSAAV